MNPECVWYCQGQNPIWAFADRLETKPDFIVKIFHCDTIWIVSNPWITRHQFQNSLARITLLLIGSFKLHLIRNPTNQAAFVGYQRNFRIQWELLWKICPFHVYYILVRNQYNSKPHFNFNCFPPEKSISIRQCVQRVAGYCICVLLHNNADDNKIKW